MSQTHIPAAMRRRVRERSGDRCEYCLLPEAVAYVPHWIDHIVAEKHGGATELDNLANSCTLCNRYKGSDLSSLDPETGLLVPLFHPRTDRWSEHFSMRAGRIEPLTPTGRVTVRLLQLNRTDRIAERDAAEGLLDPIEPPKDTP